MPSLDTMDTDSGPRGQKRLLDPEDCSASPRRLLSSPTPHEDAQYVSNETMSADLNSTVTDKIRVREESTRESTLGSLQHERDHEQHPIRHEESNDGASQPSLKKIRFDARARQGSAPPRLELGFNVSSSSFALRPSASTYQDASANVIKEGDTLIVSDSARDNAAENQTSGSQAVINKTSIDTRMEGLLDDLETEVTCGLCAGVFIDVSLTPVAGVRQTDQAVSGI